MSLKRKKDSSTGQETTQKKPKIDFFASKASSNPSSGPPFKFRKKDTGAIRLTTWNVNGIKSINEKILRKYLDSEAPDILVLTETRYSKGEPDIFCLKSRYKYRFWGTDSKSGQAGTAVLSNIKPLNDPIIGLPDFEHSTSGRYDELEFEHAYVVGTYVPNSGEELQNLGTRQKWNESFASHLRNLHSRKPVIWCGDFNCIPSKEDLDTKARLFWDRMGGLSEQERSDFKALLEPTDETLPKFADVWRKLHPSAEEFTHSSDKFGAWRLDSFILSEQILDNAIRCEIRHDLKDLGLSDHWPVTLDIKGLVVQSSIL